ncbi:uncharacterized protein LOC112158283 [Oryzias melastigma]|uniref:uncharacterized protein LOC112158283 n=1 Tax=Oryzias melastigma TaxID=30732 RepID=UPI000CF7F6B1|nr:uncharacterized protein LOC112158283 [Oryzias melastigma]
MTLTLIVLCILYSEGISEQIEHLYHRVGDDVPLPCRATSSSFPTSIVNWLYQKDKLARLIKEVQNGKVVQSSSRASRLSVSSDCSLFIRNITDQDAGFYVCRLGETHDFDGNLYLNTLSVSSDSPEVHPRGNGDVTLLCSLNRYDIRIPCKENSIIWRDERGSHLTGEVDGFEFRGQTNCVSVLTVKHQSGNNKRFTCQFIEDDNVKIEAVYVLEFSESPQSSTVIIIGAVVGLVLVLLVVFAVLFFRSRRAKTTKDQKKGTNFPKTTHQKSEPETEPDSDLTYAAVNHSKSRASSKITIKETEGEVTYSSIKMK